METTVTASSNGKVEKVYLKEGTLVQSEDLILLPRICCIGSY